MNDATRAGLMASATLATAKAAPSAPAGVTANDAGAPPNSSLDPDYVEPLGMDSFAPRMVEVANAHGPDSAAHLLVADLLARVVMLEEALKPFAMQGMSMTHARMALMANGRPTEPAGGTWVSQLEQIRCLPNEVLFYNAIDAYGRARTEGDLAALFEKAQAVAAAQRDQAAHVEAGGKVQ